jgi:hypothetical protein
MGARYVVVPVQVGHEPGGDRLLARVEVDEARDLARRELGVQPLLKIPDGSHRPVRVQQLLLAQLLSASDFRHGASFPLSSSIKVR